jgi:CheY-like chemotaxis protein
VHIPVSNQEGSAVKNETAERRRVVVADDDDDWRDLLAETLEGAGYEVEQASDGRQLQTILEAAESSRNPPDLVVSDHRMPNATGLEVLAWAMLHAPDIPFILLSAFSVAQIREPALELGAAAVLQKPIDAITFYNQIDTLISQRRRAAHKS